MKIAFLGYDRDQTILVQFLEERGHDLDIIQSRIEDLSDYDLVISFGYRHILTEKVLATSRQKPINLHISYLPYNKGAHPNFWSWAEDTPSGVTIHQIESGIDTGGIIFQQKIDVDNKNFSFSETYKILISSIENLFISKIDKIENHEYDIFPQLHRGTYHQANQLPEWLDWDMNISYSVDRYRKDL